MKRLVALVTVTLAAAIGAAPAMAAEPPMTWEFATTVATEYWADRGVSISCEPQPVYLTREQEAELAASVPYIPYTFEDPATCGVLITPLAEWHRARAAYAWEYCAAITHELGHLAGLTEAYGGVMIERGPAPVPFGCSFPRQWKVMHGWRKPPRWVNRSPARVERLWLAGRVWRAKVERRRALESR